MKTFIICPICDARGYIVISDGLTRRCTYCKGKGFIIINKHTDELNKIRKENIELIKKQNGLPRL